jgi:tetrahydromethanopterin S-methyltransferase subunit G
MATRPERKDVTKQIVCKPGIMEAPTMNSWNDNRLDEFSRRTDESLCEVKAEIKDVRAEMRAGFARVDEEIKEVRAEMREGFAQVDQRFEKVDQEFKDVRQEMKERFAQMRGDMNQRLNILTGLISALIVAVVGAGILG